MDKNDSQLHRKVKNHAIAEKKHGEKWKYRKGKKKIPRSMKRERPRTKNWEAMEEDELDELEFQPAERVMPRGEIERRALVDDLIKSGTLKSPYDEPDEIEEAEFDENLLEAIVTEVSAGACRVLLIGQTIDCSLRQSMLDQESGYTNPLAVGDRVLIDFVADEQGVVEHVLPRSGGLARLDPSPKGRAAGLRQIVAANVEQLLIVASWREPNFWPELVDRFLITAQLNDLEPILCVNKIDLVEDQKELEAALQPYRLLGLEVVPASAVNGVGIGQLADLLVGETTVLAGMSGVGKSSLLNAVEPGFGLRVGRVGVRGVNKNQGRHTTTQAFYLPLAAGGAVIDTPGIREFGLSALPKRELADYFPEMAEHIEACAYNDCSHIHEDRCAVKAAVDDGLIHPQRYKSYTLIYPYLRA